MAERLKEPPLVEALCEFRFAQSAPWDWTLPGRLYDQIREEFPERGQVNRLTVEIKPEAGLPLGPVVNTGIERIQMKRPDGSAMVQIGPHLMVANQFRPYPGWPEFRSFIVRTFETYTTLSGESLLDRIGLRYINHLPLLDKNTGLSELITVAPKLLKSLDRPLVSFYQRLDVQHDDIDGILVLQTGTIQAREGHALMIDLDFGSVETPGSMCADALLSWLDNAHDRIEAAFIDILNSEHYARLKGAV